MKDAEGMSGFKAEYGSGDPRNGADSLDLSAEGLGQNCSPCCPQHCPQSDGNQDSPIGKPLTIQEVAELIGVSAWTLRHRYIPAGLPHLRVGYSGKLIFYKNQIIRWLLWQQQKGGTNL